MLKKTGIVVGLLGMFALSALLMSCGSGSDRPAGLLYVVSQSLANMSSYAVDLGSGDLSLITNNLTNTCQDSTCGLPLTMSVDPTGATAFVLSQNAISGFNVHSDGSLSTPTTAATMQGGQTAIAMSSTTAGDMMFVISVGAASPTDCPTDGGYVTDSDCPAISVYSTSPGSISATLTGNNCAALNGPCPFSLSRIPTGLSVVTFSFNGGPSQTLLFVTSNFDLTDKHNDSELSVFSVDSSGNLSEQSASPYTAQAPNPLSVLAVNTNPAGQNTGGVFVYVGSQAAVVGSLSVFEVCTQAQGPCTPEDAQNENLAVVGKPSTVGQNPIVMLADPTNTFLYVACNVGNNVYAFKMNTTTGVPTALSPALQPTGAGPVALSIQPSDNNSNEYLYVSNNVGNTLSGYIVNLTTGNLSNPLAPVIFPPGNPYGIAGH
ncbi:MAG: beta-propeller fold lactonase family protein [Terriglobales bacterium]